MQPDELRARLRALGYSSAAFASFTGVDPRTVRRWLAGAKDVPPWVPVMLACLDRIAALEEERSLSDL